MFDKFSYYNWANNKWARRWMIEPEYQKMLKLKAQVHYVPLWYPEEVIVDLNTHHLVIPTNLANLVHKYQLPKTNYYLFKYHNIANLLLESNYIISNYSKMIEAKLTDDFVSLKWSQTYGAYFFKKITNYILKEDRALEFYRDTKKRVQKINYLITNPKQNL
ncbi:hypothetical protein [Spiroplasma eriocheiris]|uniref:Uncharacterized protein n=1 Tax=Spiroplasma eriocheiris TaxID=315358 RepID=A0A0H3XME8_9MOLU|nr:hypothetical protein [Spiroplasma eriocheiris]AHF57633.1 hypothetical protein SPE_0505 [Spiroplasma eriocheiris CCTCC M 207170]AKM54087.1 hypothetical protein SERIO_v1c05120 [Spiroplasma eriocheiris]